MLRSASIFIDLCRLATVVVMGLLVPTSSDLIGQDKGVANRRADAYVVRTPHGFVGISYESALGSIRFYNDSLGNPSPLYLTNAIPVDLALPSPPQPTTRGVLLTSSFGHASLYLVRLDTILTFQAISRIWESNLPPMRRIVGIGDFDRDGRGEVAVIGDSVFAVIGLEGEERYVLEDEFLDALVYRGDSARLLVASRQGGRVLLAQIDPAGGAIRARQFVPTAADIMMTLIESAAGDRLVIVAREGAPTAYIYDPQTLALVDTFHIAISPLAIIQYRHEGSAVAAAVFNTLPVPTLLPLVRGGRQIHIDYPLQSAPEEAIFSNRFNILIASDSIALYDRSMTLLSKLPSTGGRGRHRLTEIDSTRLLLSSQRVSQLYQIPTSLTWLERNWLTASILSLSAILVVLMMAAARRYRFIRTIYNNLVRVPGSFGVLVVSSSQKVMQINQSARSMLEIDTYIPVGRHVSEYLVSDELGPVRDSLRHLFTNGESFDRRIDVTRGGKLLALSFRGRPMAGTYGFTAGYLVMVEDVTRTLERERLVNWASVAHHIAHEMKTPLGTVTMTAEMLHDRLNTNGTGGEFARATSRIIKQSGRLREIVDDLLMVARTESLQKVNTDMAILLASLTHDHGESLPPNVSLRLHVVGDDFRCMVDVNQMIVALRNLLDNAWQAIGTREGGLIQVTLEKRENQLEIKVEDNGIGMTTSTLARLFQPFYTERQGGSGIGTVIIQRVVESHGGSIEVDSERGRGTRFRLRIPRGM